MLKFKNIYTLNIIIIKKFNKYFPKLLCVTRIMLYLCNIRDVHDTKKYFKFCTNLKYK